MAGLTVLALASAGCSEPEQPSTSLPTAASTSAEPTLEPLGPADFPVPDEAREKSQAGAQTMATYFLDLVNFATSTSATDAQSLIDLSSNCTTCQQIAAGVQALAAAGQRVDGAELSVQSFGSITIEGDSANVVWLVTEEASRTVDSSGQDVPSEARPGQQLSGGIDFSWDADRSAWIVTQVVLDSL